MTFYAFSISHIEFLHSKTRVSFSGQQHKCCPLCPILTVAPFCYSTQLCSAQPGIWAVLCQLTSPQQVSGMFIYTVSLYYSFIYIWFHVLTNVMWATYICDTACFSCSHVSSGHPSVSALCTTSSLTVSSVGYTDTLSLLTTSTVCNNSVCVYVSSVYKCGQRELSRPLIDGILLPACVRSVQRQREQRYEWRQQSARVWNFGSWHQW